MKAAQIVSRLAAVAVVIAFGLLLAAVPSQAASPTYGWKELLPRHNVKPVIISGHSQWPGALLVTGPSAPETGLWSDDFRLKFNAPGWAMIQNRWSELCLGVRGAAVPGALIEQQLCHKPSGADNMSARWFVDQNQPLQAWAFRSTQDPSLVIEVPYASMAVAMPLRLGSYWGGLNQQFFRADRSWGPIPN